MQKSLDANRLLALVEDGIEAGTLYVSSAKRDFREQNLSEGMRNLLMAFGMFLPYLRIHKYTCENVQQGPEDWSIAFGVHIDIRFYRLRRLTHIAESPIYTSEHQT